MNLYYFFLVQGLRVHTVRSSNTRFVVACRARKVRGRRSQSTTVKWNLHYYRSPTFSPTVMYRTECVLVYGFLCVLRGRRQVADHHVLQRAHVRPQPRRRNHRPHKMGGISSCSFNSPGRGRGNQSQHREGFVKGVTEANGAR